jgi:hypothetical protein
MGISELKPFISRFIKLHCASSGVFLCSFFYGSYSRHTLQAIWFQTLFIVTFRSFLRSLCKRHKKWFSTRIGFTLLSGLYRKTTPQENKIIQKQAASLKKIENK